MATISEAANMTLVINSSSILRLRVFLTEQKNTCSCFSKKKNPQKKEIFGKRLFQPLQRKGGALVLARPAFFQSHAHHTFLGTHTHTLSLSLSCSLAEKKPRNSECCTQRLHTPKPKKYENIITAE